MIVEAILEYSISPHLDLLFFYFDAFSWAESLDWYLGQSRAALYFLSRKLSLKGIFPPNMLEFR